MTIIEAFSRILSLWGRLDIVCNNAAVLDEDDWNKTLNTNLVSFNCFSLLQLHYNLWLSVNIENLPSKRKFRNSSYTVRKNPLVKHFRKSQSKFPKSFLFQENRQKVKCCPTPYSRRSKTLNYTIFKALGKKDGSRKQVHLWQVSKASQLQ